MRHLFFTKLCITFFVVLALSITGFSQSAWVSGASYSTGNKVSFESVIYEAKNSIATSYTQPKYAPNDWLVLWVDNSPWISNIYYEQGNIVIYNAIPFKAKVKISNPGCSPIDCASEWDVEWIDNSNWIQNITYAKGDIVKFNTNFFKAKNSIVDKNNNPLQNCNEWELLPDLEGKIIWNSGLTVSAGTIVLYNSQNYISLQTMLCTDGNRYTTPDALAGYWKLLSEDEIKNLENRWESTTNFDGLYYNKGNVGIGTMPQDYRITLKNIHTGGYGNVKYMKCIDPNDIEFMNMEIGQGVFIMSMFYQNGIKGTTLSSGRLLLDNGEIESVNKKIIDITSSGIVSYGGSIKMYKSTTNTTPIFVVNSDGKVGIGVDPIPTSSYTLAVRGGIATDKITVKTPTQWNWPDFVFEKDYKLLSLQELDAFIKTHKHLPNIPSATQVNAEGIDLGQMNAQLLQKIEELTLYIIQLHTITNELQKEVEYLKNK